MPLIDQHYVRGVAQPREVLDPQEIGRYRGVVNEYTGEEHEQSDRRSSGCGGHGRIRRQDRDQVTEGNRRVGVEDKDEKPEDEAGWRVVETD